MIKRAQVDPAEVLESKVKWYLAARYLNKYIYPFSRIPSNNAPYVHQCTEKETVFERGLGHVCWRYSYPWSAVPAGWAKMGGTLVVSFMSSLQKGWVMFAGRTPIHGVP